MLEEEDNVTMIQRQLEKDSNFFKGLLDLVPASAYFSIEDKDEIWGNISDNEEENDSHSRKKRKKHKSKGVLNPMSTLSVTQITEMRMKGETLLSHQNSNWKNKKSKRSQDEGNGSVLTTGIESKHQAKKQSRFSKNKKKNAKEVQRRETQLEELREKLRKKLESLQIKKNAGKTVAPQEEKRLKRQEKKVNSRLKNKNSHNKANTSLQQKMLVTEGLKSSQQNKILNEKGQPVKSKFDFSMFSTGAPDDKSRFSELQGRDYKRLLEKVERRQQKIESVKSQDSEAGQKLEEKTRWLDVIHKAKGERVKDDPTLLKKAARRKEKKREHRQKKWDQRTQTVEDMKQKRQDKRKANIDKRKSDKKEKVRKKLIKKGRIIPGF